MATRNYVPRANGEGSIGTEKKHWGGGFFDKLAVNTLEVIGGGTDIDAQPATVGWVKRILPTLLKSAIEQTGFSNRFGVNGFVAFGSVFGKFKLQWGRVSLAMLSKEADDETVRNVTLPIGFEENTYTVFVWDNNPMNNTLRVYKACPKDTDKFQVKVLTYNGTGVEATPEDFSMAYFSIGR